MLHNNAGAKVMDEKSGSGKKLVKVDIVVDRGESQKSTKRCATYSSLKTKRAELLCVTCDFI